MINYLKKKTKGGNLASNPTLLIDWPVFVIVVINVCGGCEMGGAGLVLKRIC